MCDTLGKCFREIRNNLGWSLAQVGKATGIRSETISRLEFDRTLPNINTFGKLIKFYKISYDDYLKLTRLYLHKYFQRSKYDTSSMYLVICCKVLLLITDLEFVGSLYISGTGWMYNRCYITDTHKSTLKVLFNIDYDSYINSSEDIDDIFNDAVKCVDYYNKNHKCKVV